MHGRVLLLALAALLFGCNGVARLKPDAPDVIEYLELVRPRTIEIQGFLTKPISLGADGKIDGIQIILEARDALGDRVKSAGTFIFELYETRIASADRRGQRIGLWRVQIRTQEDMREYWDMTRFHSFRLQLEQGELKPGKYILAAQLQAPGGVNLFDEYELTHTR